MNIEDALKHVRSKYIAVPIYCTDGEVHYFDFWYKDRNAIIFFCVDYPHINCIKIAFYETQIEIFFRLATNLQNLSDKGKKRVTLRERASRVSRSQEGYRFDADGNIELYSIFRPSQDEFTDNEMKLLIHYLFETLLPCKAAIYQKIFEDLHV